ncbi:MAG: hypothetical protein ACAI35_23950 [Candidatus Methylacidiphilales bacterium]
MKKCIAALLGCLIVAVASVSSISTASAQDGSITSYRAYIGDADRRSTDGQHLHSTKDILQQDRANFHRYGIRQRGDTGDNLFESPRARQMFQRVPIRVGRQLAEAIHDGDVLVTVTVYRDVIIVEGARRRGDRDNHDHDHNHGEPRR